MLLGTVVALSVLSACSLHMAVLAGGGGNSPNIFVQNGDAAHSNGSKRQVIECIHEAGPEQTNLPQQHGADGCATLARCYLLVVLLGGSFFNVFVLSACWRCP